MTTLAQRNFAGGEIAPAFQGRVDVERVASGLATCRNWCVEKSGAVANRAGFSYRGMVRGVGGAWRLVASVRDLNTTYLLELGHQYCRVWKGGAPVSVAGAPAWDPTAYQPPGSFVTRAGATWYAIAAAMNTSGVTLALSGGPGTYACIASGNVWGPTDAGNAWVLYDPQGNAVVVTLGAYVSPVLMSGCTILATVLVDPRAVPGSLPASLDPAQSGQPVTTWSSPLTPASGGGAGAFWYQLSGNVVEFPTPWADADLRALNLAQSIDVMTFVHPAYPPTQIRRYSDTRWQVVTALTEVAILAPGGCVAARANGAGGPFLYVYQYQVTAVDTDGNESDPSAVFSCLNAPPSATGAGGFANFVSWNAVAGAVAYNVYRQTAPGSDIFGFIMTVAETTAGAAVSGISATGGQSATSPEEYLITAATANGFTVAQGTATASSVGTATAGNPVSLAWTAVAGATGYWVYALDAVSGLYFLIATPGTTAFSDVGRAMYPFQRGWSLAPSAATLGAIASQDPIINPDASIHPGVAGNAALTTRRPALFVGAGNYPAAVAYFQQRYVFAQTSAQPENVWMSQAANYASFASSFPSAATDAVIFTVNGYRVNPVRHLVDMGALLLFTDNGVYSVQGGTNGVTPTALSVHQENYVGCQGGVANLSPVIYDNTAVYLQARGTIVRSIRFDLYTNGFRGDNQSLYSQHLLDGFSVPAWTWAEVPGNGLWMARADGVLLCMTFIPEQQITGWSRHDSVNGAFEDVCAVPELRANGANEDVVYALVRRVVSGVTVRCIERMESRLIVDPLLAVFSDCASTYDGRNRAATTVTISGGTLWDQSETLTLTASASNFTPANGAVYVVHDAAGDLLRFTQVSYVNAAVVTGTVDAVVPAGLRGVATAVWSAGILAVQAAQLAGQGVAVLADGEVVSPVMSAGVATYVSADGAGNVALPIAAEVVVVGLPITADVATCDIETRAPAQSLSGRQRQVEKVVLRVDGCAGLQAGPDAQHLADIAQPIAAFDAGAQLVTGVIDVETSGTWDRSGSVLVRQARPLPARILSIAVAVNFGE